MTMSGTNEPGLEDGSVTCHGCGSVLVRGRLLRDQHGRAICPRCPAPVVRVIEVPAAIEPLLSRSYAARGRTEEARPAFSRDALDQAERALHSVIPDAVLALAIARGWTLERLVGLTEERTAYGETVHGPKLGRRAEKDLVVFDSWGDWPTFSAGYRPTRDRSEPAIVVWDWKSWTHFAEASGSLLAYLRDWLDETNEAPDAELDVVAGTTFRPVLEETTPLVRGADRCVSHPKFGRGRVLEDRGDKLTVDFAEHGVRTLAARFVRDVPFEGD